MNDILVYDFKNWLFSIVFSSTVVNRALPYLQGESLEMKLTLQQGTNARKVNCGRVYSAYKTYWNQFSLGGICKQE